MYKIYNIWYFILWLPYMTISRIPEWPVLFEWRKVMIIVVNVHIFKNSADLFCKPSFIFFSWSQ